jgi:hypothetical protein
MKAWKQSSLLRRGLQQRIELLSLCDAGRTRMFVCHCRQERGEHGCCKVEIEEAGRIVPLVALLIASPGLWWRRCCGEKLL